MSALPLDHLVRTLEPGGEASLSLRDVPLDELLLTLHEARFSGEVEIGIDRRVLFRGGHVVVADSDAEACRRELLSLYEREEDAIRLRALEPFEVPDLGELVSPLPVVAYGIVVRARPSRRQAMHVLAANKRVRLCSPYDASRNRYGLPRPLLQAVQRLEGSGVVLGAPPAIPGLTPEATAGLLLLFHRVGLLAFGEVTRPPDVSEVSLQEALESVL